MRTCRSFGIAFCALRRSGTNEASRCSQAAFCLLAVVINPTYLFGFPAPFATDDLERDVGHNVTVETLVEILSDEANPLRIKALRAAVELWPDAAPLLGPIIAALSSHDNDLRRTAASRLGQIGS